MASERGPARVAAGWGAPSLRVDGQCTAQPGIGTGGQDSGSAVASSRMSFVI